MHLHHKLLQLITYCLLTISSGVLHASSEFDEYLAQQQDEFTRYQKEIEEGFLQYQKIYSEELKSFSDTLGSHWAEPKLSSPRKWVSYYRNGTLRQTVDFQSATVILELQQLKSLSNEQLMQLFEQRLSKLLVTTEADAFEADLLAQSVERRIVKEVKHVIQGTPGDQRILAQLLPEITSAGAEGISRISKQLLNKATMQLTQEGNQGAPTLQVDIQLKTINDDSTVSLISRSPYVRTSSHSSFNPAWLRKASVHPINKRSLHYQPLAEKSAKKEKLSAAMVLAIMETESSFNPMAKSHIPAYGLMQVVPRSAGRDATAYLFGKAKILAPSYLYNSDNNVMIGSAYLHQLYYRYMRFIKDPQSRLYCTIAAYNTGPGNVAKAFSDTISIRKVAPVINRMSAEQVYKQLETQLPYEETRNYMRKVTTRMQNYSG